MNQPLEHDDYVRLKLDNTERANKLSPLYSQDIYRVNKVNQLSNTQVIIRIDSENTGIRTKKFLCQRRRPKNVYLPNKRILKFWNDFPNSSEPLRILRQAIKDKVFASDEQKEQQDQKKHLQNKPTENPTHKKLTTKKPINYHQNISQIQNREPNFYIYQTYLRTK